MKKVERRRYSESTMALMNLLRDIPNKVVQMMMDKGYTRVLTVEERLKMAEDVKAFTDELYGEKVVKEKKAKPQVVQTKPEKVDRAYLETLTVTALKELGKDCPRIKGRKPRPEIIEILLQELGGASSTVAEPASVPSIVAQPASAEDGTSTDEASSDDELRAEVPPPFVRASATVSTTEVADKKKAKAKPKAEKPAKEKPPKEKKEKKTKPSPVPVAESAEESDEEQVLTVKEWFHPNDMSKPKEERTKYYIDPATNYIYDPEDTEEPMGQWDEATKEIIPVG
jgi:hypothetical protein